MYIIPVSCSQQKTFFIWEEYIMLRCKVPLCKFVVSRKVACGSYNQIPHCVNTILSRIYLVDLNFLALAKRVFLRELQN